MELHLDSLFRLPVPSLALTQHDEMGIEDDDITRWSGGRSPPRFIVPTPPIPSSSLTHTTMRLRSTAATYLDGVEADLWLNSSCPPTYFFIYLDPHHDEIEIDDGGIPRWRGGGSLPRFTILASLFIYINPQHNKVERGRMPTYLNGVEADLHLDSLCSRAPSSAST